VRLVLPKGGEIFILKQKNKGEHVMKSNYDVVIDTWREKFLTMDMEKIVEKFNLKSDEEALYITYYSQELRIDRITGVISYVKFPEKKPNFNTVINIYNLFHYSIEKPVASGELVPFRLVKRVYPFEDAYKKTILQRLKELFTGKVEILENACKELGGTPFGNADVGYELPVFPFLNVAVLFWDSDEEFEAQVNMLFDSNITDFMHEENVVGVASDAVYYLAMAAGFDDEVVYGE
jgi:hypothetical protein